MNGTLDENPPIILDSTCSFAKHFPEHASIRMDLRLICHPDIVADCKFMPFRDGVFDEIYCDPPHMIRKDPFITPHELPWIKKMMARRRLSGRMSPNDFTRYGWFPSKKDWLDFLISTNNEFAKCLKPSGVLKYKLTSGEDKRLIHRADLEALTNFKVVKEKIVPSKTPKSKNLVHYVSFMLTKS